MNHRLAIKNQIVRIFFKSGGFRLISRYFHRKNAFVLMYHRIIDSPEREPVFVQPGMFVTAQTFRQHIAFIKSNFHVLSLRELLFRLQEGKSVKNCCAVTFDDGWQDTYAHAYPVLLEFGIPATVFLATGSIGSGRLFWPEEVTYYLIQQGVEAEGILKNSGLVESYRNVSGKMDSAFLDNAIIQLKKLPSQERADLLKQLRESSKSFSKEDRLLMDWEEVREMNASGLIHFGGHTVNHEILDQIPLKNAEEEIIRSFQDLEDHLGSVSKLFAYPNGNFNPAIKRLMNRNEIKGAVTTKKGWVTGKTDLLEIPRIGIHEDISQTIPLFLGRIFLKGF